MFQLEHPGTCQPHEAGASPSFADERRALDLSLTQPDSCVPPCAAQQSQAQVATCHCTCWQEPSTRRTQIWRIWMSYSDLFALKMSFKDIHFTSVFIRLHQCLSDLDAKLILSETILKSHEIYPGCMVWTSFSGGKPYHMDSPSFLCIQQESAVRLLQKLVKATVADLLAVGVSFFLKSRAKTRQHTKKSTYYLKKHVFLFIFGEKATPRGSSNQMWLSRNNQVWRWPLQDTTPY